MTTPIIPLRGVDLKPPFLTFECLRYASDTPIEGRITLHQEEHRCISWPGASGLANHQELRDCWTRGKGPIPPSNQICGSYWVNTVRYMSQKAGGPCFHITPDPLFHRDDCTKVGEKFIPIAEARMRGELLIHGPGKFKGTNGCIEFVHDRDLNLFIPIMDDYCLHGLNWLPLAILYY